MSLTTVFCQLTLPETVPMCEDLKYIYIGCTSFSFKSIKTLLDEKLFPNLDLVDISGLQFSIYDPEQIRNVFFLSLYPNNPCI